MTCAYFQIDDLQVPIQSVLEFSQTYAPISGSSILRMLNGRGVKQQNWLKIGTDLSGSGWCPAGLDGLDYSIQHTLHCVAPRSLSSTSAVIVLPSERRTDAGYEPRGYAYTGGMNNRTETPVTLVGDTATLDAVPGVTHYVVSYFPLIEVFFVGSVDQQVDVTGDAISWSLSAEQV